MNTVVSPAEWRAAREALLAEEKAMTRALDALRARRAAMPWVRVEKEYVFATPDGPRTLAQLFGPNRQLVMQHFMFGTEATEGCVGCSFGADHVDPALPHLAARGVGFVAVSRAPLERLMAFRARMGWRFAWVSSLDSDFNYDFGVSFRPGDVAAGTAEYNYRKLQGGGGELPGMSAFYLGEDGSVFHTYSTYARGDEAISSTYALMDMAPLGRNEAGIEPHPMAWVKHHDRYGAATPAPCCAAG
jgi:predicted dithiol-disulfide oxidoreductase (DUF899 family)